MADTSESTTKRSSSDDHNDSAASNAETVRADLEKKSDAEKGRQQQQQEKPISSPHDVNLVTFHEGDKENPRNWSTPYKAFVTFQLGMLAFAASVGSSIISPANDTIAAEFGVSNQVMVLTISLYVLGFATGPLCWAGISEIWGRKVSMLPPMIGLALFSIGTGVSQSAAAVIVTRFFGGVFACATVSNVSAALGDMYDPYDRGTAVALYAIAVVGGPTLGPIIGSAIVVHTTWRWILYTQAILTTVITAAAYFSFPEMYAPVVLKWKAQRLRKETGNQALYHPHEQIKLDFTSLITKHLGRPLRMLFTEPMVSVIALYASYVYSILYMSLEWVPIIFEDIRGFSRVPGSLPFLGLFVGIVVALAINIGNQSYYHRAVNKAGGKAVPEARLPPMMIGSVLFCGGLFWLAWTADPACHFMLPIAALLVIGMGFECIFLQSINILVDSYPQYAASAVSANTILRSLLAAGMPLVVSPMYSALGVPKSLSILAALAGAAIPVPFLFMKYGKAIRSRSSYANPSVA